MQNKTRTARITIMLTAAEKQKIKNEAWQNKKTMSDYVRDILIKTK